MLVLLTDYSDGPWQLLLAIIAPVRPESENKVGLPHHLADLLNIGCSEFAISNAFKAICTSSRSVDSVYGLVSSVAHFHVGFRPCVREFLQDFDRGSHGA